MPIKEILATKKFEKNLKLVRDRRIIGKIKKQIIKIKDNPEIGKPLRYHLKGERAIYIKPYRLIYAIDGEKLILLRFLHRKKVYR